MIQIVSRYTTKERIEARLTEPSPHEQNLFSARDFFRDVDSVGSSERATADDTRDDGE